MKDELYAKVSVWYLFNLIAFYEKYWDIVSFLLVGCDNNVWNNVWNLNVFHLLFKKMECNTPPFLSEGSPPLFHLLLFFLSFLLFAGSTVSVCLQTLYLCVSLGSIRLNRRVCCSQLLLGTSTFTLRLWSAANKPTRLHTIPLYIQQNTQAAADAPCFNKKMVYSATPSKLCVSKTISCAKSAVKGNIFWFPRTERAIKEECRQSFCNFKFSPTHSGLSLLKIPFSLSMCVCVYIYIYIIWCVYLCVYWQYCLCQSMLNVYKFKYNSLSLLFSPGKREAVKFKQLNPCKALMGCLSTAKRGKSDTVLWLWVCVCVCVSYFQGGPGRFLALTHGDLLQMMNRKRCSPNSSKPLEVPESLAK